MAPQSLFGQSWVVLVCYYEMCDFENVRFFVKIIKFEDTLNDNLLKRYFQNEIDGYKQHN